MVLFWTTVLRPPHRALSVWHQDLVNVYDSQQDEVALETAYLTRCNNSTSYQSLSCRGWCAPAIKHNISNIWPLQSSKCVSVTTLNVDHEYKMWTFFINREKADIVCKVCTEYWICRLLLQVWDFAHWVIWQCAVWAEANFKLFWELSGGLF